MSELGLLPPAVGHGWDHCGYDHMVLELIGKQEHGRKEVVLQDHKNICVVFFLK